MVIKNVTSGLVLLLSIQVEQEILMNSKETTFKKVISDNEERIRRICSYYAPTEEDRKDMFQEIMINA